MKAKHKTSWKNANSCEIACHLLEKLYTFFWLKSLSIVSKGCVGFACFVITTKTGRAKSHFKIAYSHLKSPYSSSIKLSKQLDRISFAHVTSQNRSKVIRGEQVHLKAWFMRPKFPLLFAFFFMLPERRK